MLLALKNWKAYWLNRKGMETLYTELFERGHHPFAPVRSVKSVPHIQVKRTTPVVPQLRRFVAKREDERHFREFPENSARMKQMSRIATDCGNGQNKISEPCEPGAIISPHPRHPPSRLWCFGVFRRQRLCRLAASSTTLWSIPQTKAGAFICQIRQIRVLFSVK
jgi:hypothetical protein